jgi:aerobic carbon-monoxide dehydrogenase medium subunit
MLPARFEYAAPTSIEEVLSLLGEHGDEAKVLAGGQSLIPLMKLRLARPALLIDLGRVPGLDYVEEGEGGLRIGAMTRNRTLVDSEVLAARYPTMAATAPLISDPIIRNLGTIGGSLAHADPAGDWGSTLLALRGEVVARRAGGGERTIPVSELFAGTFTTTLAPEELLTEVRVPRPAARAGGTYLKLERKVGDFATAAAALALELDDGRIGRAGIGLTAVGSENLAAREAEEALAGAAPGSEAFAEAGRLAAAAADPFDDVRGSADYKREVVRVFVERGLARAHEIALGR